MTRKNYNEELNISLWEKESGNALSHGQGLTKEQVEHLQKLQVGDRIILFRNKPDETNERKPHLTLKKFNPPSSDGGL